jgi:hypothetical protein
MGWLRTVFILLRAEFFPNVIKGLISLFAFSVAVLTALGIFFKLVELPTKIAPNAPAFLSYVWTTFIVSCLFIAATSILLQRLLRRHEDIGKLNARLDRAVVIHHHMAETVRIAAAKGDTLDLSACLDRVLGQELREYLKDRLGNYKIHCTVKRILPPVSGGFQLIDVFRDSEQSVSSRPPGVPESADDNYIYSLFKNASINDAKQIYIPDVNSAGIWKTLSERAHSRGYKSVLAFPLNLPVGPPRLDRTVGFLGLDSPEPHAFDKLFDSSRKRGAADSVAGPDGVYKPLEELNFLYGLADSVATILMLVQHPPRNGSDG